MLLLMLPNDHWELRMDVRPESLQGERAGEGPGAEEGDPLGRES